MVVRTISRASAVFLVALVMASQAAAQDGVPLSGRLLISLNGTPLGGATIQIEELRRQATSSADGTFTFENVPPGTYHLSVLAQGFSTRRTEVTAAAGAPADRAAGRLRPAFRGGRIRQRRRPKSVRHISADIGAGRSGTFEAARDVAWRHAGESAWCGSAELRSCSGATGDSRTRW